MKRSTSLAQTVFLLIVLFAVIFNANAFIITKDKPLGGPRQIIQQHSAIEITQTTAKYLSITVVDEDGIVIETSTTEDATTTISTTNWESGEYTVQTIDDNADYQEDIITVD